MTSYGFRVFELNATPVRKMHRIAFTDPEPDGLHSTIRETLEDRVSGDGEANKDKGSFTRFDRVDSNAWGILVTVSGGYYGEPGEVVDVANRRRSRRISSTDAVLRESRVLMLVPPYGDAGLIIAETRGRSHLTANVLTALNNDFKDRGLKLRTVTDLADEHAWSRFLDSEEIGIRSVELVQNTRSSDRTNFTGENVRRSTLRIDLEDGTDLKSRLSAAVNALRGTREPPNLAGMIGLAHYRDEDFDEERIIAVVDGRDRTIRISSGWPSFTYAIDGDDRPTDQEFVDEACNVASTTFPALNVELAVNWRPTLGE